MKTLTPIRTARVVSILLSFIGVIFISLNRVVHYALFMVNDILGLALARYSNFTGRFAAENFAEDKQLLALLKNLEHLIPSIESLEGYLLIIGLIPLILGVLGILLPRQFLHLLAAVKIIKWAPFELENVYAYPKLGRVSKIVLLAIAGVFVSSFILISCHEKSVQNTQEVAIKELYDNAFIYIKKQKDYFKKKQEIGNAKQLEIENEFETEFFKYRVSQKAFSATSKVKFGKCPENSKWIVSASTKGFFTQTLQLYRGTPKDRACEEISPKFKEIGKPAKKPKENKPKKENAKEASTKVPAK